MMKDELEELVKDAWETVKTHRSRTKMKIDKHLDPAMAWLTAHGIGLWGLNEAMDYVATNIDSNEGLATLGAIAGWGALAKYGNKHVVKPMTEKIKQIHEERLEEHPNTHTALSTGRTLGQMGGMAALWFALNMPNAVDNFQYDANRIVNAFARPTTENVVQVEEVDEPVLERFPLNPNGGPHMAGALEGMRLGNSLAAAYTGITGPFPEQVQIDFDERLASMWENKIGRSNGNSVVRQVSKELNEEYDSHSSTKLTIDDYVNQIDNTLAEMKHSMDWEEVGDIKGLSKPELRLLQDISTSLQGRDLISYSMTELMESHSDGKKNRALYDFLLRNAGREYIESIPALGDPKTSFGPYQFTEFAVFENGKEKRGASRINQALPHDQKIPGSVRYLRGDDHHRAAFLFAVNNLGSLISGLDRSQFGTLSSKWQTNKDDIVKYIATAHHRPTDAREAARRWLDHEAEHDYTSSVSESLLAYSTKTQTNLEAIYPEEVIQSFEKPKEIRVDNSCLEEFTDHKTTNSQGKHVFSTVVEKGDNPTSIAREFNQCDDARGDEYATLTFRDVVDAGGNYKGSVLKPGEKVYLTAPPK